MWSDVQQDFADILASRVFPALVGDPGYVRIFHNAGMANLIPRDPSALRPGMKSNLDEAARMCAQLLTLHVEGMGSLRERRAKALVVEGPVTLYRLWSQRQNNRIGPWWFTEGVLHQATSAAAGNRQAALEWLRDRLAISLDWSDCDRIAKMTLHYGNAVPAIAAWGLPMRQYSRKAATNPDVPMRDYWARYTAMFQGEKTQYFLPFLPATRISDFW